MSPSLNFAKILHLPDKRNYKALLARESFFLDNLARPLRINSLKVRLLRIRTLPLGWPMTSGVNHHGRVYIADVLNHRIVRADLFYETEIEVE